MGVGGETKLSKFIAEDGIKKQLNQSKERGGQRELGISAADRHTRFSLQKKKCTRPEFSEESIRRMWKGTGQSRHVPKEDGRDARSPQEQLGRPKRGARLIPSGARRLRSRRSNCHLPWLRENPGGNLRVGSL